MTRYAAHPDMVARTIRGEDILVPIAPTMQALDSLYALNETAAFIRQEALNGLGEDAIRQRVEEIYAVDTDTAERDVRSVLSELVRIGALRAEPAAPK